MKNKYLTFLVISIILPMILVSCEDTNQKAAVVANQQVPSGNNDIKEEVEKINQELEKLVLAGNYNAILPYYTDDIIICSAFHPEIKGKDAIKDIYDKNEKSRLKHHSFSGTIKDIWECENLVYERGVFGTSLSSKDSPKPSAYYGSYFTIWEKSNDGSLKIKYVIWNLDFNPYK
ncbi:MAG: hypothetical protein KGZ85_16690 [Ignavibacterium sp.]|nr:hypothetical protein [Ignavibacterium sp.]